jgi:chromosome segregation ATPase
MAEQQLKRIHEKLQQLLRHQAALSKDNNRLREELEKMKAQTARYEKNIEELKQQVTVLKVGAGEMNASDKKEFEKRINGYIKEIDRCIALLGE